MFKDKIRVIEGFPKEGISFKDITTLLEDGDTYRQVIDKMVDNIKDLKVDIIVGPEARGFLFAPTVAYALGVGFVPVRKPGKLPGETVSYEYELEYGTDELQIHKGSIKKGDRVVIIDDLLATGGTVNAAAKLIESQGGEIVDMEFLVELTDLNGRDRNKEYHINALVQYDI